MATLKFSDGEEFELSGQLRKEHRADGWYVLGENKLIPVKDEQVADEYIYTYSQPYKYVKTEFENKLKELGFSYQCNTDGQYILCPCNESNSILNSHLILSEPVDSVIQGSRNNNKIQAIGLFTIRLSKEIKEQDFLTMAFQSTNNHNIEFIIIPIIELKRRLSENNRIATGKKGIKLVFWLMPDNCLYDCTNLGIEAEWYFMSKGLNGRLADGTELDYTDYLNRWDRLKMY